MWVYVGHCSLPSEVARFPIKTTRESRCAADRWQVSTTSCETVQFSGADSVMVRCAGLCGVGMIPRWIPFFACAYDKNGRHLSCPMYLHHNYWVYSLSRVFNVFNMNAVISFPNRQKNGLKFGSILEAMDFGPLGHISMPSCIQSTAWLLSKYVGTPQKTNKNPVRVMVTYTFSMCLFFCIHTRDLSLSRCRNSACLSTWNFRGATRAEQASVQMAGWLWIHVCFKPSGPVTEV